MRNIFIHTRFGVLKSLASILTLGAIGLAVSPVYAGEYTNFIGIKLVDIPSGSFKMGSCKITDDMRRENRKRAFLGYPLLNNSCEVPNRNVNDNETPQHLVHIRGFRLGATHVTLRQYNIYLKAIEAENASSGWHIINDEFKKLNSFGDNKPVVQVSWHEAKEFIEWLNKSKPANDPHVYRLASEAEWEYACRAGEDHTYCGSNNLNEVGWVDDQKGHNNQHQQDVATKAPNAWGIYDMTGNVWEWVEDAYHDTYVGAPTDGSAWTAHVTANVKTVNQDFIFQTVSTPSYREPAYAMPVSTNAYSEEQRKYDERQRARYGTKWKRDTATSRVLRGGSWRFGPEFAGATYRLSGEPGNWYYGNGFRIAATVTEKK